MKLDPRSAKPTTQEQITAIIDQIGKAYPPEYTAIMKGIAKKESEFMNIPGKLSNDHGVFQINSDAHATAIKNGLDPYDPVAAAKFAFSLLDSNVKATGSMDSAIAAYNGGAGRINTYLKGKGKDLNPITKEYAPKVMAFANQFQPGLFPLDKINATSQKFGYGGKTDFVALSGGKKNLSGAFPIAAGQPTQQLTQQSPQQTQQQPQQAFDVASSQLSQGQPQGMDSLIGQMSSKASVSDMAPQSSQSMDSAIQSIQPENPPTYSPEQDNKLAAAFDFSPENSLAMNMGLPKGLMDDIRREVERA